MLSASDCEFCGMLLAYARLPLCVATPAAFASFFAIAFNRFSSATGSSASAAGSHSHSASAAARMIPPGYAGPFRTPFDAFMRLVQPYDSWATTEYVLLEAGVGGTYNLTQTIQATANLALTMRNRKQMSFGPNMYMGIRYLFD